jgi:hypothetical protein
MSGYGTQPFTGINQKPLVFAQIRQGVSAPEVSKARVVESARVIDISSNRFLHMFYRKPYMKDMGYDHGLDGLATFRVKTAPDARPSNAGEILAAGPFDVGSAKSIVLSERQFLTMSDCSSWEFKPSVKVADFFANSLGVPIECWTPCSRIQMARELEEADLIKFELECGAGESQDCAMTAGELALALNEGDASDFDPFDDLHGNVQLSVLFVNAHPDIQPLDFRLRMCIKRCECEPMCYVHATTGKVHKVNDGLELKEGDLARLGYNQTCLGFTVSTTAGRTVTMAMKYALFAAPSNAFMDFEGADSNTDNVISSLPSAQSASGSAATSLTNLQKNTDGTAADVDANTYTISQGNAAGAGKMVSGGSGVGAVITVTVAADGAITYALVDGGSGHAANDVLTIAAGNIVDGSDHKAITLTLASGNLSASRDWTRRVEQGADAIATNTATARGMHQALATQSVWCSRAGEVLGVSRGQLAADDDGAKFALFELDAAGDKLSDRSAGNVAYDAEGVLLAQGTHAGYNTGSGAAGSVDNAGRKHWRDHHHYAGANADHFGSPEETQKMGDAFTFAVLKTSGETVKEKGSTNDATTPKKLFEELKDAVTGDGGTLVDTSVSGDVTLKELPEAVAERLDM